MKSNTASERRLEAALFTIPLLTYAYFYQGSDQSTAARFDLMRSILERATLWIDGFCGYNTADIIIVGGHYYSVKAPGTSLICLLPWVLIRLALLPLMAHNEPLYWALVTYLTIVVTIGVLISLLCVVMYRFARYFGASQGRAAGLALILAFATIMFPYATEMTGEPFAGAFAFISFYLIATWTAESRPSRAFWAGLLAGLGVLNDYPVFLAAAAIGFYALYKLRSARPIVAFSVGAALTAVVMFGYNWIAFGSPLFFSYQAFKLPENTQFPEQAVGFVGLTYPKINILWNILADPQRGLFFCNPVLLLAIPGAAYFLRRRDFCAEWIVTVVAITGMILFNASYGASIVSWGGGTATGPRQIIAAVPFMVLTLVFLPAACNWLIGALAALSAFVMLMATSTNPHFPYEYGNPVRDFALQQFMRGDFATNRDAYFGGDMIVGDSVAFNLGKLVRLPGPYQLLPLGALWIVSALEITDAIGVFRSPSDRRLGNWAIAIVIAVVFFAPFSAMIRQPLDLNADSGLLGRYFVGNVAGVTPPHVVRIDPQIEFNNIAEMGAMPFPSVAIWSGRLIVPHSGVYRFVVDADDAGWLSIDGRVVIPDPGPVSFPHAVGAMALNEGIHRIEVGERNIGGDSSIHLYWKPPGQQGELIPSDVLIPDHP
ncbi:MAG: PA14 domain-containing protein [Candidatus Binataceae bacterium]